MEKKANHPKPQVSKAQHGKVSLTPFNQNRPPVFKKVFLNFDLYSQIKETKTRALPFFISSKHVDEDLTLKQDNLLNIDLLRVPGDLFNNKANPSEQVSKLVFGFAQLDSIGTFFGENMMKNDSNFSSNNKKYDLLFEFHKPQEGKLNRKTFSKEDPPIRLKSETRISTRSKINKKKLFAFKSRSKSPISRKQNNPKFGRHDMSLLSNITGAPNMTQLNRRTRNQFPGTYKNSLITNRMINSKKKHFQSKSRRKRPSEYKPSNTAALLQQQELSRKYRGSPHDTKISKDLYQSFKNDLILQRTETGKNFVTSKNVFHQETHNMSKIDFSNVIFHKEGYTSDPHTKRSEFISSREKANYEVSESQRLLDYHHNNKQDYYNKQDYASKKHKKRFSLVPLSSEKLVILGIVYLDNQLEGVDNYGQIYNEMRAHEEFKNKWESLDQFKNKCDDSSSGKRLAGIIDSEKVKLKNVFNTQRQKILMINKELKRLKNKRKELCDALDKFKLDMMQLIDNEINQYSTKLSQELISLNLEKDYSKAKLQQLNSPLIIDQIKKFLETIKSQSTSANSFEINFDHSKLSRIQLLGSQIEPESKNLDDELTVNNRTIRDLKNLIEAKHQTSMSQRKEEMCLDQSFKENVKLKVQRIVGGVGCASGVGVSGGDGVEVDGLKKEFLNFSVSVGELFSKDEVRGLLYKKSAEQRNLVKLIVRQLKKINMNFPPDELNKDFSEEMYSGSKHLNQSTKSELKSFCKEFIGIIDNKVNPKNQETRKISLLKSLFNLENLEGIKFPPEFQDNLIINKISDLTSLSYLQDSQKKLLKTPKKNFIKLQQQWKTEREIAINSKVISSLSFWFQNEQKWFQILKIIDFRFAKTKNSNLRIFWSADEFLIFLKSRSQFGKYSVGQCVFIFKLRKQKSKSPDLLFGVQLTEVGLELVSLKSSEAGCLEISKFQKFSQFWVNSEEDVILFEKQIRRQGRVNVKTSVLLKGAIDVCFRGEAPFLSLNPTRLNFRSDRIFEGLCKGVQVVDFQVILSS